MRFTQPDTRPHDFPYALCTGHREILPRDIAGMYCMASSTQHQVDRDQTRWPFTLSNFLFFMMVILVCCSYGVSYFFIGCYISYDHPCFTESPPSVSLQSVVVTNLLVKNDVSDQTGSGYEKQRIDDTHKAPSLLLKWGCVWIGSGVCGLLIAGYLYRVYKTIMLCPPELDVVFSQNFHSFFEPQTYDDALLSVPRIQSYASGLNSVQLSNSADPNPPFPSTKAYLIESSDARHRDTRLLVAPTELPLSLEQDLCCSLLTRNLEQPLLITAKATPDRRFSPLLIKSFPLLTASMLCCAQLCLSLAFKRSPPWLWASITSTLRGCDTLALLSSTPSNVGLTAIHVKRLACCASCLMPGVAWTITTAAPRNRDFVTTFLDVRNNFFIPDINIALAFVFGALASLSTAGAGTYHGMSQITHLTIGTLLQGATGVFLDIVSRTSYYLKTDNTLNGSTFNLFLAGFFATCGTGALTLAMDPTLRVNRSRSYRDLTADINDAKSSFLALSTLPLTLFVWSSSLRFQAYPLLKNASTSFLISLYLPLLCSWMLSVVSIYFVYKRNAGVAIR